MTAGPSRGVPSLALFAITSAVWGSTWLAIVYQLGRVPPEVSVSYRFALAGIVLAAWCAATGRFPRFALRDHAAMAAQGALMFGFNYIGVYWSEQHLASGLTAVLFSTIVFMNMVGARVLFAVPMTARALAGASLGVLGVALLFLPELDAGRPGGRPALGIAYALGATVLSSLGNMVAVRNQKAGLPVLASAAWGMGYGAVIAALVATAIGAAWTFDTSIPYVLSLAYLALFGSIVAFGAYLTLVQRIGAGPASYVGVVTPVVALALSTWVEGYRWSAAAVAGVVLALAGNVLVLRPRRAVSRA